jgi:hypothetical protein
MSGGLARVDASQSPWQPVLRRILAERQARNPQFSIRALVRGLSISHTTAANLISGSARLSLEKSFALARELKLSDDETALIILRTRLVDEPDPEVRSILEDRIKLLQAARPPVPLNESDFEGLPVFRMVLLLEHLEFTIGGAGRSTESLSRLLGEEPARIREMLGRLQARELVQEVVSGEWVRTPRRWTIESGRHSLSIKAIHRGALEAVEQALREIPPSERYSATQFLRIPVSRNERLRVLCDEFAERLHALAGEPSQEDEVHLVSLHAFPWLKRA